MDSLVHCILISTFISFISTYLISIFILGTCLFTTLAYHASWFNHTCKVTKINGVSIGKNVMFTYHVSMRSNRVIICQHRSRNIVFFSSAWGKIRPTISVDTRVSLFAKISISLLNFT